MPVCALLYFVASGRVNSGASKQMARMAWGFDLAASNIQCVLM